MHGETVKNKQWGGYFAFLSILVVNRRLCIPALSFLRPKPFLTLIALKCIYDNIKMYFYMQTKWNSQSVTPRSIFMHPHLGSVGAVLNHLTERVCKGWQTSA